jgi:Fe-S-cluster containining protein
MRGGQVGVTSPTPDPECCFDELLAVYAALDEELAVLGVTCKQCGRCCNFVRNDYRLYASFLERSLVLARHGEPRLTPEGDCGFLRGSDCSIHPHRPLNCRTYFCDSAHKAREQDLYHVMQRRIRAIADAHGLPWEYGPFFLPPEEQ